MLDVNEFAPVFSELSYQINVREDEEVGNQLLNLSAFDGDSINPPAFWNKEVSKLIISVIKNLFIKLLVCKLHLRD